MYLQWFKGKWTWFSLNLNSNLLFFNFKPSQMELVWKLQIFPYNHTNINSYSGRTRQIRIYTICQIFSNRFEPPINLAQIQKQFVSWIFNSNSVSNLNFHLKGTLFIMRQDTLIEPRVAPHVLATLRHFDRAYYALAAPRAPWATKGQEAVGGPSWTRPTRATVAVGCEYICTVPFFIS
jgi:hypothetical protein